MVSHQRLSQLRYPDRARARRQLYDALARGVVVRPRICEGCGKSRREILSAHHEDYSQPLIVKWLCRSCHGAAHRKPNVTSDIRGVKHTRCLYCGKRLKAPKAGGRPRRYCSNPHKNKAYRARIRHLLAEARA